jgi:hypothetical protein
MTAIATSRCRNARLARRSATGHSGARSDTQPGPQLNRSSSLNAAAFDRSDLLIHRNRVSHSPRSLRHNSNASSAALKSP